MNRFAIPILFFSPNPKYTFNGKDVTGIYDKTDLGLSKNLIHKNLTDEQKLGIEKAKGWYQDYMDRVINRKLY